MFSGEFIFFPFFFSLIFFIVGKGAPPMNCVEFHAAAVHELQLVLVRTVLLPELRQMITAIATSLSNFEWVPKLIIIDRSPTLNGWMVLAGLPLGWVYRYPVDATFWMMEDDVNDVRLELRSTAPHQLE